MNDDTGATRFGTPVREHDPARDAALGAVAGIGATLVMSVVMLAATKAGILGKQPPRKLSERFLGAIGRSHPPEHERRIGTTVIHLGIGAVAAAAQQLFRGASGRPGPSVVWGALFGALLYAVNYFVLAPAARVLPQPWNDRPGRPPVMALSNVLYGAVAAAIGDRLVRAAARPTSD